MKSQQLLVPRQVYIGDRAELRCTFNSASSKLKEITATGPAELSLDLFDTELDSSNYEIKDVKLLPSGVDFYQLSITFVPWKTGSLQFPQVILEDTIIDFEAIEISSIVKEKKLTSIKESQAPFLLPGTTYKLYATLIIIILLIILIVRLIVKHQSVSFFIRSRLLQLKCWHSKKVTEKKLRAQLKSLEQSDKEWAENTQKIMRKFLSVKYQLDLLKLQLQKFCRKFLKLQAGFRKIKTRGLNALQKFL